MLSNHYRAHLLARLLASRAAARLADLARDEAGSALVEHALFGAAGSAAAFVAARAVGRLLDQAFAPIIAALP